MELPARRAGTDAPDRGRRTPSSVRPSRHGTRPRCQNCPHRPRPDAPVGVARGCGPWAGVDPEHRCFGAGSRWVGRRETSGGARAPVPTGARRAHGPPYGDGLAYGVTRTALTAWQRPRPPMPLGCHPPVPRRGTLRTASELSDAGHLRCGEVDFQRPAAKYHASEGGSALRGCWRRRSAAPAAFRADTAPNVAIGRPAVTGSYGPASPATPTVRPAGACPASRQGRAWTCEGFPGIRTAAARCGNGPLRRTARDAPRRRAVCDGL